MRSFKDLLFEVNLEAKERLSLPVGFDLIQIHGKNSENKNPLKVLHVSLEYGMPNQPGIVAVGGIGSVLKSLTVAQQQQTDIDSRVIMPYYPKLQDEPNETQKILEVTHWFNRERVQSTIYKTINSQGVVIYLARAAEKYENLFSGLTTAAGIYSDIDKSCKFIERVAYFSGAAAAFAMLGENTYIPHIVQAHGWGLCFVGKLILEYRKIYGNDQQICSPSTIFTVHSAHNGDGSYDFTEVPDMGVVKADNIISVTKEIAENYDHLVYVSEQLLKESISNGSSFKSYIHARYLLGNTSAILNNIHADEFDPALCLPKKFAFDNNAIADSKLIIKQYLNENILAATNKQICLDKPLTMYLGRYSDEKGIDKLDMAIELTVANGGTFMCMGIGSHPLILNLINKYALHKNVIFFTTRTQQKAYGKLARCAADIYFVPSRMEACCLVPMEANLAGAIVVASSVGGLINVVKPDANGFLFYDTHSLRSSLTAAQNKWLELKASGNLNICLQLIQESARKSFDWHADNVGAAKSYHDLYFFLSKPKPKIVVLNMSYEYKQVKLGGVGEMVTALCDVLNKKKHELQIESRVITPYYPWHEDLIKNGVLKQENITWKIAHLYLNQEIYSEILVINNTGTIQYLVKPLSGQNGLDIFQEVTADKQTAIYDTITPKMTYFNSAVAAFVTSKLPDVPKINILNAHSWGCGLTAKILKDYYNADVPRSILTVHSEFSEQGVITNDHEHMQYMHGIGLDFIPGVDISPLVQGMLSADHVVYVSEDLERQSLCHSGPYSVKNLSAYLSEIGHASAIINNISGVFDPENLKLDLSNFYQAKIAAKNTINQLIDACNYINNDEKNCLSGKFLDPDKSMTMFVGRFLHEKGINNLQAAIEATLDNNGCFVVMGLYGGGPEDQYIQALASHYSANPNIIILHEKTYTVQRKYGPLIRLAADFTFIPSHRESCGLVSMEAQLNASMVISSDVGGLNGTVFEGRTGFMYLNGHEGVIYGRRNTNEVTAAINRAHVFLRQLKLDQAAYNKHLNRLYEFAKENYIWEGKYGSLTKYVKLFNTLNVNLGNVLKFSLPTSASNKYDRIFKTTNNDVIGLIADGKLGGGFLATVYSAQLIYSLTRPHMVGTAIAIKQQDIQTSQEAITKLRIEKNILAKVDDLVLPYLEHDPNDVQRKYLFLRLYNGHNLFDCIRNHSLSLVDKLQIAEQITHELAKLHAKNILHLDLHCRNVMVKFIDTGAAREVKCKIIDFGASRQLINNSTTVKIYDYMQDAPFEVYHSIAGKYTDVYCLGLCLAEMFLDIFWQPGPEFKQRREAYLNASGMGELVADRKAVAFADIPIPASYNPEDAKKISKMQTIICNMLQPDYNLRPSIEQCIAMFESDNAIIDCFLVQNIENFQPQNTQQLLMYEFHKKNHFGSFKPTTINEFGYTPLTKAVDDNDLPMVQLLVANDVSAVAARSKYGFTPLQIATAKKNPEIISYLRNVSETVGVSYNADELLVMDYLRENKFVSDLFHIDKYNDSLHTPLTKAASMQDLNICRLLVKCGADINQPNALGNIALHNAMDTQNLDLVQGLLDLGADPDFVNDAGFTPRSLAMEHNFKPIEKILDKERLVM